MNNNMSIQTKITLACMALGIIIMLGASFMQRINNPNLVIQARGSAPAQNSEASSMPMSPEVGNLMEALKEKPNDVPTLIKLSEHLIESSEWGAAENFIHRALELNANNAQAHYLHGIVLYNSGNHDESAKAFEQVLALGEDASARYSLGILQLYHFKDVARGIAELEKGLNNPNADAALKAAIQAELEKAKAMQ